MTMTDQRCPQCGHETHTSHHFIACKLFEDIEVKPEPSLSSVTAGSSWIEAAKLDAGRMKKKPEPAPCDEQAAANKARDSFAKEYAEDLKEVRASLLVERVSAAQAGWDAALEWVRKVGQ